MLVSEVKKRNDILLAKLLKIEEALKLVEDKNISIEDCGNAELYYFSTSSLSAQAKAPMGEKFVCRQLGLQRVSSREGRGDAKHSNGCYYEFKNSFTNQAENLNIRQLRLWQEVDFYYCFYINEENLDKSVFFVLSKEEMIHEVELCGGFTHGTISANSQNLNNEYSITIPIYKDNNEKTKRWKERYFSQELKQKILKGVL